MLVEQCKQYITFNKSSKPVITAPLLPKILCLTKVLPKVSKKQHIICIVCIYALSKLFSLFFFSSPTLHSNNKNKREIDFGGTACPSYFTQAKSKSKDKHGSKYIHLKR